MIAAQPVRAFSKVLRTCTCNLFEYYSNPFAINVVHSVQAASIELTLNKLPVLVKILVKFVDGQHRLHKFKMAAL